MKRRTAAATIIAAIFAITATFASPAVAGIVKAVEYFHPVFEHYFVTADPAEIAALDTGAVQGWWRTGQRYRVDDAPAPDLVPVCRFYTSAYAGKPSHFFTASAADCEYVKGMPDWTYEGVAFYARVPDAQGKCSAGTAAIHRMYNAGHGGAPNHAYTADPAKVNTLAAAGWAAEGVAFCTPLATPDPAMQVTALHDLSWDLPAPAAFSAQFNHDGLLVEFLPVTTENFEAADNWFQRYGVPVPPARLAHWAAGNVQPNALDGGGGAGWDPLTGEYVFVMAGFGGESPYDGIMWTFGDTKGPDAPVCTMGIARNAGVNNVDAGTPHAFQPFILSGCEMGVAKKLPADR